MAFIMPVLTVFAFGSIAGLVGLYLIIQIIRQNKQNGNSTAWTGARAWVSIWAVGLTVQVIGWLLRFVAGEKTGTSQQVDDIGALLICLSPVLWLVALFILRPHRTKLERLATSHEEEKESVWPPPPTNRRNE